MYMFLNNEVICLDHILNTGINEKESYIIINYFIEGQMVRYRLDYSDRKIDPNEKETDLQKDFKKLKNKLCKKEVRNV